MNIDSFLGCRLFQKSFLSGIWLFLIFLLKIKPSPTAPKCWDTDRAFLKINQIPATIFMFALKISDSPKFYSNKITKLINLLMKQENHQLIIVKPPFFDASTHILPFGYLTVRHGKIHHAIKFGKPGKPSISMGHGLTMAMLKNQRVYIYIYIWWEDYDGWSFWEDYDGWSKNGFPK